MKKASIGLLILLCACLRQAPSELPSQPPKIYQSSVSQRLQWHENLGYCGETSFIQAGLTLGQYTSQYAMRALASQYFSPPAAQNSSNGQLLIGTGDDTCAANRLGFEYVEFDYNTASTTKQFLKWIKEQMSLGYPVVIGVYLNEKQFYGRTMSKTINCTYNPNDEASGCPIIDTVQTNCTAEGVCQYGDSEYDHIVTVINIQTSHPCSAPGVCEAHDDDIITIDDHGLFSSECDYGNQLLCPKGEVGDANNLCGGKEYTYLYSYSFADFQKTREEANNTADPYSLCDIDNTNGIGNYGIAIKGLQPSPGGDKFFPVSLTVTANYECPAITEKSPNAPTPPGNSITLSGVVSGLTPGHSYVLDQYDDFAKLPVSDWNSGCVNKNSHTAGNPVNSKTFTATGITYPFSYSTTADQTVIYRVRKAPKS